MHEFNVISKVDFFHVPSRERVEKYLTKKVMAPTSEDACEVLAQNVDYLKVDATSFGLLILGVQVLGAVLARV